MLKGSTVIMSEEFIDELTRHKNNLEKELTLEDIPDKQDIIKQKIKVLEDKIEKAMDFQDIAEELINLEVPSMSAIKTVSGLILPLANVKVL